MSQVAPTLTKELILTAIILLGYLRQPNKEPPIYFSAPTRKALSTTLSSTQFRDQNWPRLRRKRKVKMACWVHCRGLQGFWAWEVKVVWTQGQPQLHRNSPQRAIRFWFTFVTKPRRRHKILNVTKICSSSTWSTLRSTCATSKLSMTSTYRFIATSLFLTGLWSTSTDWNRPLTPKIQFQSSFHRTFSRWQSL